MMDQGSLAVAIVQGKVTLVQAAHTHTPHDRLLDVHAFVPFGERIFLSATVPQARIAPRDVLTLFPADDCARAEESFAGELLELTPRAYGEFLELSARCHKRYEQLFRVWSRGGLPARRRGRSPF